MKHVFFLLILLFSLPVASQSAPGVGGDLIGSGTLVFAGKVAGYYRLTNNRQPDDENYTYTISLLGKDLQPLGNKVYKSNEPLEFEDIAYNGTYLGVLFVGKEEGGKRHIDVLNGAGERLQRGTLLSGEYSRGFFLLPTKQGFISCMARLSGKAVVFDLSLMASDGASEGWLKTYSSKFPGGSVIPRLLAVEGDQMVLSVMRQRANQTESFNDIYCVDTKTGELIYKNLQDDPSRSSLSEQVLSGALVGKELVTIQKLPTFLKSQRGAGFKLNRYDEAGELMNSRTYYNTALFKSALAKHKMPALGKDVSGLRVGIQTNPEGSITAVYEVVSKRGKDGKKLMGREYRDAYVVAINPDFEMGPLVRLEKKHFTLTSKDVNGLGEDEMYTYRRRLRNGDYDKLDMDELVTLHDGPYGLALAVSGTDYISNFFLDRDFSKEGGVIYHGVRVATYIDGEFELDYIPFKNKPDYISLDRAQEGYLKVTEYKYGEGIVDTRLERLSY